MEAFTHEDATGDALLLDLFRDDDVQTEDVVAHDFAADDAAANFARMNANVQVQRRGEGNRCRAPALLLNDLEHLQGDLKYVVAFDDGVVQRASFLGDLARIAHHNIRVPDRVQFVDAVLLAQLVELTEKSVHHSDGFRRLTFCAEVGEACDFCVQYRHIFKLVDDFLVVLDALEHVLRHQLRKQILRLLNLDVNDPVIVVDLAAPHLAPVDQNHVEDAVDDNQSRVCDVCLHINR